MKRLIVLLFLFASACLAEDATLLLNTVMRTENSLIILKAGTVVHIVKRNDKTVAVRVGNKTGVISGAALDSIDDMQIATTTPSSYVQASAPAPVTSAPPAQASTPTAPAGPRKAQTMYGKMVEKARDNAGSHEKNLVDPADEVLGGK